MQTQLSRWLALVMGIVLLVGCDMGGDERTLPTPTPTPTPAELSAQIGRATAAAESVHFTIKLTGKPVYVDETQTFAIDSVVGDLKRPNAVKGTLKVTGVVIAEIQLVSLAGKQYATNPITRAWQCVPPNASFDPAILFDANQGIAGLMQKGFEQISLVGVEQVDGVSSYHLRGSIDGALLRNISYNSLGAGVVGVDLWASVETMRATKIVLVDTATDSAAPSTWTMTFTDYDKPVEVQAPTQC